MSTRNGEGILFNRVHPASQTGRYTIPSQQIQYNVEVVQQITIAMVLQMTITMMLQITIAMVLNIYLL